MMLIATSVGVVANESVIQEVDLNEIRTLAANEPLSYDNGEPVSVIDTGIIADINGNIARGPHSFDFTLGSDAAFPVVIKGVEVHPGQTITLVENMTNVDSRLVLPVYPAQLGVDGKAQFSLDIPNIYITACPAGYTEDVNDCFKISYDELTYVCPTSETTYREDTKDCRGERIIPSTPYCDAPFTLTNGTCVNEFSVPAEGTCPLEAGWTKSGTTCNFYEQKPIQNCPVGFTQIGNYCHEVTTKLEKCNNGFTNRGDACYKDETINANEMCPSGFTLSSGECRRLVTTATLFSCNSGYTLNGQTCTKPLSETATTSCPSGYTKQGGNCTKSVPANTYCASGYSKVGTTCERTDTAVLALSCSSPYSLQGSVCFDEKPTTTTCPSGYTVVNSTTCSKTATATFGCPAEYPTFDSDADACYIEEREYKLIDPFQACEVEGGIQGAGDTVWREDYSYKGFQTRCYRDIKRYSDKTWDCPTGYDYASGQCHKNITVTPTCPAPYSKVSGKCEHTVATTKTCPSGYTQSGSQCVKTTTTSVNYQCNSGYTLSGSTCTTTLPYTYNCPSHLTVQGSNCIGESSVPATAYCPTSYTMKNGTCERTDKEPVVYECPTGWNLSGTKCERTTTETIQYYCGTGTQVLDPNSCFDSNQDKTVGNCEAGMALNTTTGICEKFDSKTVVYVCPVDAEERYQLQGNRCDYSDFEASKTKCPAGGVMSEGGASCTFQLQEVAIASCPKVGYAPIVGENRCLLEERSAFDSSEDPSLTTSQTVFSGQVVSLLPEINIGLSETPTAFVEDIQITADSDGVNCLLTTETTGFNHSYRAGGDTVCLFEWTGDDNGIEMLELENSGVVNKTGSVAFPYQVSVFNNGNKIVILDDVLNVEMLTPVESVVTNVSTKIGTEEVEGFDITNYDKTRGLINILVSVEPRTFDQTISVNGESCTVAEGETSCLIDMNNFVPGADEETLVGTETVAFKALDKKNYLTPTDGSVNINFDYRPPTVVELVLNSSGSTDSINHSVDGTDFTLEQNQGLLVLQTHHFDKDGEWWIPQIEKFTFIPAIEAQSDASEVTINEREVRVPRLYSNYRDGYNITPSEEPQFINDKVVYKIAIDDLPDAEYNITATVKDEYENKSVKDDISQLIDRNGPTLIAILGSSVIRSNAEVEPVFISDMHIYIASNWNDGSKIDSIKLDGTDYPHTDLGNGLYQLSESSDLVPGQSYTLEVSASDAVGNETIESFPIKYANAEFTLYTRNDTVYAEVQDNTISMVQRGGHRCQFTSTVELAREISKGTSKGCTLDTSSIPVGLNVEVDRRGIIIDGAIQEVGEHEIGLDIVYHNHDGTTKVFTSTTANITALEADPITIDLLDRNKVSEAVYSIPYNSRYANGLMLNYFNGDVDLNVSANSNSENSELRQSRRTEPVNRKVRVNRVDGGEASVYSVVKYDVSANYSKKPSDVATKSFDVIITPATYTRAYLEVDESSEVLTDDTISLSGKIGTFDRETRTTVYRPNEMGDWEAFLAVRQDGSYQPISEPVGIDANGEVEFTISGQTLFDASRQFFMVANAVSNIEGYEQQIRSNSAFLEVLKSGAVEGDLRVRTLESRIPFDTSIVFSFLDDSDEDVSGDVVWQTSEDGTNWSDIADQTNKYRYNVSVQDVGTTFYRVKMVNRMTAIESYSSELAVSGYDVADIELLGADDIYSGLSETYEAEISDELISDSDGVFEWSTDGGETWSYGSNTLTISPTETLLLGVRYRLNSSDGIESEGAYSTKFKKVEVREPRPLSVSFSVPRSIEVGFEGQFEGRYREPFRGFKGSVIEQITLPDGTVVDASALTYIPASEDIVDGRATFIYSAWVEGLKALTKSDNVREVNIYDYKFEAPTLNVRQRYTIAPTSAYASVSLNTDNEPPGLEVEYDWLLDENDGFEILRDSSDRVSFNINESGSKVIAVRVTDNRGNDAQVSQIVDVNEALPMTIEMTPRYSKNKMTVPLGVTMQARYDFDHPQDYPVTLKWYLDGVEVGESTSNRHFYEVTDPGAKEFKVVIDSAFGQQGEKVFNLQVNPNQPPICEPIVQDGGTTVEIQTNCRDEDGEIIQVYYSWGDEEELRGYSRINFDKNNFPNLTVTIRAIDDGGEETVATVSW